jgi:hypothetical protein
MPDFPDSGIPSPEVLIPRGATNGAIYAPFGFGANSYSFFSGFDFFNKYERSVICGCNPVVDSAIDSGVGNPGPSFKIRRRTVPWQSFRLPVQIGNRTISVDVRQPVSTADRPKLIVKRNPAVGLNADLVATATSATNWQTLSVSFTATAVGGVEVLLSNEDYHKYCWFDNLKIQ